jgi:putative tryptophan/tyrosine transport system substrate-binding protein
VLRADVRRAEDLAPAIGALHVDAWYVQDEILYAAHMGAVIELLAARRKPAIYPQTPYVEAGGLMSYAVDLLDQMRRAAAYIDKILRGAKPAGLPVEQPRQFELAFNLKTARAFGVTIPQRMLMRAAKVFE